MFENIRKCLIEYEDVSSKFRNFDDSITKEDLGVIDYFVLHFSQAVMKDLSYDNSDEKIAKIILATKGLSNEIKVKVE